MSSSGKVFCMAIGVGVALLVCAPAVAADATWGEPVFTLKRVGQFDHSNNVAGTNGVLGPQAGDTSTPGGQVTWPNGTRIRVQLWVSAPGSFGGGQGTRVDCKALVTVDAAKGEKTKSLNFCLDSWSLSDGYARLGSGVVTVAPGKSSSCALGGSWRIAPGKWEARGSLPSYRYFCEPVSAGLDRLAIAKAKAEGRFGAKTTSESFHSRGDGAAWCGPISGRFKAYCLAGSTEAGSASAAYAYEGVTRKAAQAAPVALPPRAEPPPAGGGRQADGESQARQEQQERLRKLVEKGRAAMTRLEKAREDLLLAGQDVDNLSARMGVAVAGLMDESLTEESRALARQRVALMRDQRAELEGAQDKLIARILLEQQELALQLRLALDKTDDPQWRRDVSMDLARLSYMHELLPLALHLWANRMDKVDALAGDLASKSSQRKTVYRLWAAGYLINGDVEKATEKLNKVLALDRTDAVAREMLKKVENNRLNDAAEIVMTFEALMPKEAASGDSRSTPGGSAAATRDDALFNSINGALFGGEANSAGSPAAVAGRPAPRK